MLNINKIISVPPQIIPFEFSEEVVNQGDGVSVTCSVSKGDYPLNITWAHNSVRIKKHMGILTNRVSKRVSTLRLIMCRVFMLEIILVWLKTKPD